MPRYKAYIPRWEIELNAKNKKEARQIAYETLDDHQECDPQFGEVIIKKL